MRTLRDDSKLYEEPICELPLGSGQPIQGAPKAIGDEGEGMVPYFMRRITLRSARDLMRLIPDSDNPADESVDDLVEMVQFILRDEHGEKPPTDAILDGMTQGEALRLFRIACGTEDL